MTKNEITQEINAKTHDIEFLKKEIKKCEGTSSYTFHWHGKIYTLYGAERILRSLSNDLEELIRMKTIKRFKK